MTELEPEDFLMFIIGFLCGLPAAALAMRLLA